MTKKERKVYEKALAVHIVYLPPSMAHAMAMTVAKDSSQKPKEEKDS